MPDHPADIAIDLSEMQRVSESIRSMLLKLRSKHDLAKYEYTRQIRVAPGEFAHSHPILTLNTRVREENALLSLYLHEQMHWYENWYSHSNHDGWMEIWASLTKLYPDVPAAFPEGARTAQSSYLHLIVNWLEIAATADFLGMDEAIRIASGSLIYAGLYKIVLTDWDTLTCLYRDQGLSPIRLATTMTDADFALAARMEEAATD